MAHSMRVAARVVAIAILAGACSGADQSRSAGEATDSAALAASAGTPAKREVSTVMIGRQIGPGNRITEPTFEFAPKDTVFVSVGIRGTAGAENLTAAWRSQNGEIVQKSSEPIPEAGENVAFRLAQPKGMKPGTYKVILFLGEDSVETKVFVVKK